MVIFPNFLLFICLFCTLFVSFYGTKDVQELISEEHELPPIYVLNLDRSVQRWDRVSKELEQAGLQAHRFPAVDGKLLSAEELRNSTTALSRFFQPPGVIGCYLSHRKFWQLVIDQQIPEAIILEDDVQLVDNFKEKLHQHLQQLNRTDSYDVILLGGIGRIHPEGKDRFISKIFSSYIGGVRKHQKLSKNTFVPTRAAGTHAYMVSYQGAQKLLNLCPRATFHVDLDVSRVFLLLLLLLYDHLFTRLGVTHHSLFVCFIQCLSIKPLQTLR
jgi:GR25 family glycosyltransferase involved in LPS biosynthesis